VSGAAPDATGPEEAPSPFPSPRQDLRALYLHELAARGLSADLAQQAALEKLALLREQLIARAPSSAGMLTRWLRPRSVKEAPRGLYLWGPVGRGKTWLMDLFFSSLPFREARRRHFHRFMQEVHCQLGTLKDQETPLEEVAEQIARDTRVLCFDELFVTDIADAMILGGLFEALFRRGVALVATSNSPPAELYKDGLQRQRFLPAIDHILRHVEVVRVDGGVDYRRRQLTQAGTYLPAAAPATPREMEALFAQLSGHASATEEPIEAAGRLIPVIRRAPGTAWFSFEVLCGGPRSQNDYIQIAREHASVLLSDVPVLDAMRDNEARRFIALVDELYDRRVKLIVSAAAAPAELYRGEALASAFERTVSRLIEMGSEEYLGSEHRP
jgi:cell division protein ZapE